MPLLQEQRTRLHAGPVRGPQEFLRPSPRPQFRHSSSECRESDNRHTLRHPQSSGKSRGVWPLSEELFPASHAFTIGAQPAACTVIIFGPPARSSRVPPSHRRPSTSRSCPRLRRSDRRCLAKAPAELFGNLVTHRLLPRRGTAP